MMTKLALPGLFLVLSAVCSMTACSREDVSAKEAGKAPPNAGHLFTRLPSSYTGVRFANRLTDTREMNVFTYRNYYNGGGVALADITGDGLPELFLTSNQKGNKLYVNRGDYRFTDVTEDAGVEGKGFWATGATF